MTNRKFKFLIHSLEGTGHLNACIGFGQELVKKGHECVFIINESLAEKVQKFGFRVAKLEQIPDDDDSNEKNENLKYSENPAKDMAISLEKMGLFTSKTPLEKIISFETNEKETRFMNRTTKLMQNFNPQFEKVINSEHFDCLIIDHFVFPPAYGKSKLPWILLASVAPLTVYDTKCLPPPSSGYPLNDKSEWEVFREAYNKSSAFYNSFQDKLNEQFNYVNNNHYTKVGFFMSSPFLNVYQYPKELDYTDVYEPPSNYHRVDAFCRFEMEEFQLPEEFIKAQKNGEKLVYLSMGSMGGFDIDLMKRICNILSKIPKIKTIVSKGPRGDEYELPANCWGDNYLPQTVIVNQVDLVITHGGNNSFTETFLAGKPMIVMPLFGDQYDNAQRIQETGYGCRIEPYNFHDEDLVQCIDKLLNDKELAEKLQMAKKRIEIDDTKGKVVEIIEQKLSMLNMKKN